MQTLLRLFPLVGLAAFSLAARPADAQTTYFPVDATINYSTPGDAFVGYDTGQIPSSPTISLVPGGHIRGICEVYNGSTFTVQGGIVDDILWGFGTSTLNVSSGLVGSYVYATKSSTVNISGGAFGQFKGISFADVTVGAFTFTGPDLSAVLDLDPNRQTPFGGTDYILTGHLQNGDSVTGDVIDVASGATMFTLAPAAVPEASSAVGLGAGLICLAGLVCKARKRRFLSDC